jgi:RNA polymerase sigma-70 factor, ECF subfamily
MSFEEIYQAYWQKIFRLCMGYVNDYDAAQDLAQETFIIVWRQLPNFRGESGVGTWIYRIATNNCLRSIEKGKRFSRVEVPESLHEELTNDRESQLKFLYKCISELPEMDRIIISLELEDVRQGEIAGITGLSESNIRVRIHRIKEKLSEKFKRYEQ